MSILDNDNRKNRVNFLLAQCVSFYEEEQKDSKQIAKDIKDIFDTVANAKIDLSTTIPDWPYENMVFETGQYIESRINALSILEIGARTSETLACVSFIWYASRYYILRKAAVNSLIADMGLGILPRTVRWMPVIRGLASKLISSEIRLLSNTVPYLRVARALRWAGRLTAGFTILVPALEAALYLSERSELRDAINQLVHERFKYYYSKTVMAELKSGIAAAKKVIQKLNNKSLLTAEEVKQNLEEACIEVEKMSKNLVATLKVDLENRDKSISQWTDEDPKNIDGNIINDLENPLHLKQIKIRYGYVVDSIESTLSNGDITKFGGEGGKFVNTIYLADDEYITQVSWTPGEYEGKKAIAKMEIKTSNGKVYSEIGNSTDFIKSPPQVFTVPNKLKIVRLVDLDAILKQTDTGIKWDMPVYIANLKMEVRYKN